MMALKFVFSAHKNTNSIHNRNAGCFELTDMNVIIIYVLIRRVDDSI